MPRLSAAAVLTLALLGACSGSGDVDASIEDAFVECMAAENITADNVSVVTRDRGVHIETFTWDHSGGADVESVGQICADAALERIEVSRT